MQRWVLFGSITCCWLLTVGSAHGQKFKLPSLLPFKSQEKSVKPFQLTDQAEAQFRLLPEKPMFGLFDSSEKREKKENGFLTSINEHSRQFWNNAGKSLSGLTAGTRDVLESTRKRLESPGWRTFNHQWWHQGNTNAKSKLPWSSWSKPQESQLPPLQPKYHMSQQPGQRTKHRF